MTNYTHALPENITRVEDILTYANTITDEWFGMVMLMTVFIIFFLSMKSKWRTEEAFGAAAFISAVTSYFFLLIGIIPEWIAILTTFLVVLAALGLSKKSA